MLCQLPTFPSRTLNLIVLIRVHTCKSAVVFIFRLCWQLCPSRQPPPGKAAASSSPATPASRADGSPSGSPPKEPSSAATRSTPAPIPSLFTAARIGSVIEDIRGDIRNPAPSSPPSTTSPPRSSSTWPPSPSSAPPTTTPSAPTRPTSSAPPASSTPSAAPPPSAPSSRHHRQVLRKQREDLRLPRDRPPRRLRPLLQLQGLRRDRLRRLPPVVFSHCRQTRRAQRRPRHRARRQRHRRRRLVLRPPHPRPRPRLPRRRARPHPPPSRHPPLAARPRTPPRLHPPRRAAPHPQSQIRHRLQLRPLRRRRPARRLDRRQDDHPLGRRRRWIDDSAANCPHEAHYLKLDASRAHADLDWTPHLRLETALDWLVQWYRAWQSGADMHAFTLAQIAAYESLLL